MTIGVHAAAAFRDQPTGVERYVRDLLAAIAVSPLAKPHRFLLYTNEEDREGRRKNGENITMRVLRAPFCWTQLRLSWEMAFHPPDVLFLPAQALPRVLPKRSVATIHGVEFDQFPLGYGAFRRSYLRFVTRDAVARASSLIAVSEATKRELIERYRIAPNHVSVVHHGAPVPPADLRRGTSSEPYFLFIGRLELKKNVDGIVRAFTIFRERRRDASHQLFLIGSPGFGYRRILREIERSPVRDAMRILGYVGEREKWRFLADATALLLPSWAEGFGMPILEAQAVGTPVVTGDTTAMPEVAGKHGALFVPSGDDEALADAMGEIAEDQALRERLSGAGKKNLERFSWERAARKTLEVLLGAMEAMD